MRRVSPLWLALKTEGGGHEPRTVERATGRWKGQEQILPQSLQKECSPADIFIFPQRDPRQTSDL